MSTPDCVFQVAPSDTVQLPYLSHQFWIGGAGNLNLLFARGGAGVTDSEPYLLTGVPIGMLVLPCNVAQVYATNTTCTLITAFVATDPT